MKRVRFDKKLTVHIVADWPQAFQEARRNVWMLKARNRRRFRKQIQSIAYKIKWCLKPKHRDSVYIYYTKCMCLLYNSRIKSNTQRLFSVKFKVKTDSIAYIEIL